VQADPVLAFGRPLTAEDTTFGGSSSATPTSGRLPLSDRGLLDGPSVSSGSAARRMYSRLSFEQNQQDGQHC
jgi:hypothetical protein